MQGGDTRGGYRICERRKGGGGGGGGANSTIECCRLFDRLIDQSAQSTEKNYCLHFSVIRMGSHGTFVLCTASSRCTSSNTSSRIDAAERS